MQRYPKSFHKADSFRPERWLHPALTNPKDDFFHDRRDAVKPFITGPNTCLGMSLAWAEMRLVLAKLVWNFDLKAPRDWEKWVKWEELKTKLLSEKRPVRVVVRLHAAPVDA